jgi:hypothetical protein
MTNDKNMTKLLSIVVTTIDSFSEKDINLLLTGEAKLVLKLADKTSSNEQKQFDISSIVQKLNESKDRESAKSVLSDVSNKDVLTSVAKSQKIHILKNDRREDIEDKIVQFFVGRKLGTEAIYNLNLTGNNSSTSVEN